ncbi:hypothetical protein JJJ17_15955 [Paracoccus caeni]|uniref:DUF4352 domain-containing protein n=1 Tax=Paracoccus caeni TaxID=657651 RepID=A0A934SN78_9RHOB|nr:hypothetical protein [Paracoccus caeni]MBK4217423.1 hypothetical protein [Paracoccus caeni]
MMRRIANLVVLLIGGGLLAGMLATVPDYNSAVQPFTTRVAAGEVAAGRLFSARFLDARTATEIAFERYGQTVLRETGGLFLIADFEVSDVRRSTRIEARWQGSSGREYSASKRFNWAPGDLETRWFQPGLTDRARAIFELPEDEIAGGRLILSTPAKPVLDSALYLDGVPVSATLPRLRLEQ